jgi:hypothetical protein
MTTPGHLDGRLTCQPGKKENDDEIMSVSLVGGDDLVLLEEERDDSGGASLPTRKSAPTGRNDWLTEAVGPEPSHSWKDEWPAMRLEEYRLSGFSSGGSLKSVLRHDHFDSAIVRMRDRIEWKLALGWDVADAEAVTCISSSGLMAVARAVRTRSSEYAAATHILYRSLVASACLNMASEPPLVYRNLTGTFGLATVDPSWSMLEERTPAETAIGETFVISGTAIASDSSDCFCTRGRGFCVPLRINGRAVHTLQDSDVVCIRSSAADERGFHSVVQTSSSLYQLPPGTSVIVERVDAPGEWSAYGVVVRRRLFTVVVTFG